MCFKLDDILYKLATCWHRKRFISALVSALWVGVCVSVCTCMCVLQAPFTALSPRSVLWVVRRYQPSVTHWQVFPPCRPCGRSAVPKIKRPYDLVAAVHFKTWARCENPGGSYRVFIFRECLIMVLSCQHCTGKTGLESSTPAWQHPVKSGKKYMASHGKPYTTEEEEKEHTTWERATATLDKRSDSTRK